MKKLLILLLLFIVFNDFAQAPSDCSTFREGYFEYTGKHQNYIIYRELDYQIEYNIKNKEWVFIKMIWVVDCSYQFTYLSTNVEPLEEWIGESATVVLEQRYSPKSYSYYTLFFKDLSEFKGTIYAVEPLSKKTKRKSQEKFKQQKAISNK